MTTKRAAASINKFLTCRVYGHHWSRPNFRKANGAIEESVVCANCTCERTMAFSLNTGQIIRKFQYAYPEGYKDDRDKRRADFRRELVRGVLK